MRWLAVCAVLVVAIGTIAVVGTATAAGGGAPVSTNDAGAVHVVETIGPGERSGQGVGAAFLTPEAADGNSTTASSQGAVKPAVTDAGVVVNVTPDESTVSTGPGESVSTEPGESVSIDVAATYAADEDVTFTLTGTQSRIYSVYVYDADGNAVVREQTQLSARSAQLNVGSFDPGSYRVVVVEAYTGEQATATFGVDGEHEPGLLPEITVDEPADPVQIPVTMPNGSTQATIHLTNEDGAYDVRATVVDEDGDGRVRLEWNTFYAGRGSVALRAQGGDSVIDAERARDLDGFLQEDEYHLAVHHDGARLDRGAIVLELEPLHTTQIGVYEAPDEGSAEASFAERTASSRVERDEWTFVVVRTQGIFGAVNATADLRSVGPDQVMLTIEPEDGSPVNLLAADYVSFGTDRIVYGFAPGNEALVADTRYDITFRISGGHPYRAGEDQTGATLNVVAAGTEPDRPVFKIWAVDAPRSVAADAAVDFGVTIVNQGERAGNVTVTLTIGGNDIEREVRVPGNGQATTELTFDTSHIVQGNRTYVVSANDSRVTGTIQVGEPDNDNPTLVQGDRDGSGAIPGFSVVGAVVALLVAVAIARTRIGS